MSTGGLKDEDLSFTEIDFANKPSRADIEVEKGDVLFAKMTNTNKALLIDKELDGIIVSTGFSVHRPKKNELDGEYLLHYLKHDYFHRQKNKLCTGAIQSAISNKGIEKIMVPVPAFPDQCHIAHILSKAENLIAQRKESIRLLDEFLKSTFLEMFGDPVRNEKGWEIEFLSTVINGIDSGWSPVCHKNPRNHDAEWAILKLGSVTYRKFNPLENKLLDKSVTIKKEIIPKKGDLLFSRKNTYELVGAAAFVFEDQKRLLLPDTIFRINYISDKVNGLFLWFLFNDQTFRNVIQSLASGAAGSMPNISKGKLFKLKIPIPPINLQTQFAQIVEKTEALKAQYQQSLQELENLYGSLSQRAFRGELASSRLVKQKQANISDKALLAFYQKQIIGHVIKKHQEHRMEQGEMILAKDLYHLEALYGIKTHFRFKNWHYGTYDNKIRQLINGKDKFFMKKSVGQKGFQVLALGEKSEALFAHKYVKPELEHIDKAMDELLELYASFPLKQRSHKIELLNTVCKSIVDAQSTELVEVREVMEKWETTKAGFRNKAEKFTEQETDEMIELVISREWNKKLLSGI